MIRKLNIFFACAIAALFGLHLVKTWITRSNEVVVASPDAVLGSPAGVSELQPHIYFSRWVPYFSPNRKTLRNGVTYDILKAIFPRAVFIGNDEMNSAEHVVAILAKDPLAVTAMYGDIPQLQGFPFSRQPVSYYAICLFLLRSHSWRYTGPASLDALRIGWSTDYNDSKVLAAFAEKWKDRSDRVMMLQTVDSSSVIFGPRLEKGDLDAFVGTYLASNASQANDDAKSFVKFRRSAPIEMLPLFFRTSKLDPELSKRLIEDFERGLHRIHLSGELRRIASYYADELGETALQTISDCCRIDDKK